MMIYNLFMLLYFKIKYETRQSKNANFTIYFKDLKFILKKWTEQTHYSRKVLTNKCTPWISLNHI